MSIEAKIEKGILTVRIPVEPNLLPTSSGKGLRVASTGGNQNTTVLVDGKPLVIGLNAYVKA